MKLHEVIAFPCMSSGGYQSALKDSDTIRVYHGTSDKIIPILAIQQGFSGQSRIARRYSYESNNNPRGLFVTPHLQIAKQFGTFVIEFHTRVADLEAPVWPGGTFTVQGQMAQMFNSNDEREMERIRQRNNWSDSDIEYIRNSDRPELAASLMASGEPQALFTGNMNPNTIGAIWASSNPNRIGVDYKRYSPREFLKAYGDKVEYSEKPEQYKMKVINPRDMPNLDEFIDAIIADHRHLSRDKVLRLLRNNEEIIRQRVWTDQQFHHIKNQL